MPAAGDHVQWLDQQNRQVGPEPLTTVIQRAQAGQIPATTLIWWEGAPGWTALHLVEGVDLGGSAPAAQVTATAAAPAVAAPATSAAVAPATASAALMNGLTDQQLDDEFMGLVDRSWSMYKETEFATSIDEVMLGGVITAMVDCGFAIIDLNTAPAGPVAATASSGGATTTASAATTVAPAQVGHELRFEEPQTQSRVTLSLQHLTADPAAAKMIGHRAAVVVGYGQRVPNFSRVGQALRQEMQSSFIASPEPGTVTFDADISSGYVYAQIDLLLELERYVDEHMAVDHELLRKHLASIVYTMQTFVQSRFGS